MLNFKNPRKYKTQFFVKSSLLTLYVALTLPIPFITINALKTLSIILIIFGLILIFFITDESLIVNESTLIYKTNFISSLLGKKNWEIKWADISLIKSLPTSQGNKIHYIVTQQENSYLIPQRINKLSEFSSFLNKKTNKELEGIDYMSPPWTYKVLTFISTLMIIIEALALRL